MLTLSGKNINLRPLEPEDLEFIYEIENNEDLWELSSTQTPYSRFLIKQYLDNAHRDIYEVKQLRLVIETKEEEAFETRFTLATIFKKQSSIYFFLSVMCK